MVEAREPHSIVEWHSGRGGVRSTEGIRTIGGVAACNFRRGKADHRQIWNVGVRWVGIVYGDVAIASSWRHPTRTAKRSYEHTAIRLTFILERQRPVSVRPAVCSLIPAPQIKTAGHSADGLDVDIALRIHRHAGLDRLSCPRGQTETLIGRVICSPRTNVCRHRLTGRAVVLAGRVGGWS